MRRKVGVAAISHKKEEAVKFSNIGKEYEENKIAFVRETFENFKLSLTDFASKHRARINSDAEFRYQFNNMCQSIGIDPLISTKGFWGDTLGLTYSNFYFELGVLIIQICMKTRSLNGGIISIDDLLKTLRSNYPHHKDTTKQDIEKSINKLTRLGNGLRLVKLGKTTVLISVPLELNKDHEQLLEVARENNLIPNSTSTVNYSFVDASLMEISCGWSSERFDVVIQSMLSEGIVWLDAYKSKLINSFTLVF